MKAAPRIAEAFHTGGGLDWGDQDPILFVGTERFFRSGYLGNLVGAWIPALTGSRPSSSAARASPTSAAVTARPRS